MSRDKPKLAVSNLVSENVVASKRNQNMNISMEKVKISKSSHLFYCLILNQHWQQLALQQREETCGYERLKRVIEIGQSSLMKHQKILNSLNTPHIHHKCYTIISVDHISKDSTHTS